MLSKVNEHLVSVRLLHFMESNVVCFQPPSSLIGKVMTVVMPLILCVARTLQSAFEIGQVARMVQIDFSAAFDRVNHQGILFKLCSVGVGG